MNKSITYILVALITLSINSLYAQDKVEKIDSIVQKEPVVQEVVSEVADSAVQKEPVVEKQAIKQIELKTDSVVQEEQEIEKEALKEVSKQKERKKGRGGKKQKMVLSGVFYCVTC